MSKPQNKVCSDTIHLQRYLDEELDESEEAEVRQHIGSCPECRRTLEKAAADESIWNGLRDHLTWVPEEDTDEGKHDHRLRKLMEYLAPTDEPNMLGRLGTYEVCGIIGQGSTGIVLKALEPALNRFVAIKVMSPLFSSSGAARKRFAREGRAVAAVSHEHVVPIYAVSEWRDLPYIVMQYIPGVSLLQRIDRDGPLETCDVARIGLQIAKGLEAAHAQGVVHRDVKPANVLLENTVNRAMVTDFGLARVADEASMTRSGTIAGTPQYMSPEQAQGESVDPRSDLFSLGSLLYAACTGRPPFRAETVFGVISRLCNTEPRPIREINPGIDEWLAAFIDKLMSKQRAHRFQSASEVTTVLTAELAHARNPTGVARPDRDWYVRPQSRPSQARSKRLAGLLIAGVAVVALAVLPGVVRENGWFAAVTPTQDDQAAPAMPLKGLEGAAITWKQNDDEWNKDTTLTFDQKVEKEFAMSPGGKLIVDADMGDVVVRPSETDRVTVSVLRRVLAESKGQAQARLSAHELSATQEGDTISLVGKLRNKKSGSGKAGRSATRHYKRVLFRIGVPAEFDARIITADGDISIGSVRGRVTATSETGDIKLGRIDGSVFVRTVAGHVDLSRGCQGNLDVVTATGDVVATDVTGRAEARSNGGKVFFTRVGQAVHARTTGGGVSVEDCPGAIDLMTTGGRLFLAGDAKSARLRASGGNILIDEAGGEIYAHATGGNITVNEIAGALQAHVETGNVYVNVSKNPTHDAGFGARAGNIRVNISETVDVNIETKGKLDAGHDGLLEGDDSKAAATLNDGGKRIYVNTSTGNIAINKLKAAELRKGLGGSGLGGSGPRRLKAATMSGIRKTSGPPRAGGLATVKLEPNGSNIDGYTLYLPESHDKHDGTFAVLVYLQGGYGVGGEIGNINDWGLPRLIRDENDLSIERNKLLLDSFIVVSPHIQKGDYHDHPEVVRQILDTVLRTYKADADRIYLTGLSRGGHGTWGLAGRMPNTFAAISPIASSPEDIVDHGALANSAIWIAQNTGDRFPHGDILEASQKIEQEGNVKFLHINSPDASGTDYLKHRFVFSSPPVDGHDAWTDMYCSTEFYKWLLRQRRTKKTATTE